MNSERRIFKYELRPDSIAYMPSECEILKIGAQGDKIFIWASVRPEDIDLETEFIVIPTGGSFPANSRYLDTVFTDTSLVWHIFRSEVAND